jgi:hypothetical protein
MLTNGGRDQVSGQLHRSYVVTYTVHTPPVVLIGQLNQTDKAGYVDRTGETRNNSTLKMVAIRSSETMLPPTRVYTRRRSSEDHSPQYMWSFGCETCCRAEGSKVNHAGETGCDVDWVPVADFRNDNGE